MGWIKVKSAWFDCPYFADVFARREALKGLQPPPIIAGIDEVLKMRCQLGMAIIMVPFDGSLLDRRVHPFDHGLRRGRLCPLVQGCLILVSRCSIPFSSQRNLDLWVIQVTVGPSA